MTPERWLKVKEVFHSALPLSPRERDVFLAEACRGDDRLRGEVESLIRSHERTGSFIDSPAYEAAGMIAEVQAELSAGERVAHYEIISRLGSGGMGEVYLAEDKRLGRKVALKILPDTLAASRDLLPRFEQEARAASALNHPNIVTIHEVGEHEGHHFIATELIEGETLRERLRRAPLSVPEALDVAVQIAAALAAAHASGIIHRDIKPENVMLRADGIVKVLDFGLAKLTERRVAAAAEDATTRAPVQTTPGLIMGTIHYMSPEQARGLTVDARTDIWSLGVVLQEMITSESPFAGPTASDTIANILEHEPPPLSELARDAPAELQGIVRRALRKDCSARYQTSGDLLADLKNLRRELELAVQPPAGKRPPRSVSPRQRVVFSATATLLLAVIVFGLYKFSSRRAPAQSESEAPPVVLKTTQVTTWPGLDIYPALSPDGNTVAYTSDHGGGFEIYVEPLTPGAREFQLTSDGGFEPAWSPDGKLIAYASKTRGGIWVVPASGGTAKQLTEFGVHPRWSPDGSLIVFQTSGGPSLEATATDVPPPPATLWLVPAQGGEPRALTQVGNPPGGHGTPEWSPDGKRIVFAVSDASAETDIWNISVEGADLQQVTNRKMWIYDPVYAPDGEHIYYGGVSATGSFVLFRQRVSPKNGAAVGEPVEVANTGLARIKNLTLSADGQKLAYSAPAMRGNISSVNLAPVTNEAVGAPQPLTQDSSYRKGGSVFSPDGQKIAFVEFRGGTNQDIWVMDADGKNETQLTTDPAVDWSPSWFPDNDQLAFLSNRQGKWQVWQVSLKSGREKLLLDPGQDVGWARLSPDGKLISFNSFKSGTTNLWVMPVEGGQPVQLTFEKLAGFSCWSPDGKWLAFETARDNGRQVAIVPSAGGQLTQLTSAPGQNWPGSFSPDGDRIVFAGQRDGIWNLYWVSRTTRQEKQLTHYTKLNSFVRSPAWSPSGRRIVYEYSESAGNIWLMELK
jgi:Tol biopolymer transport system component